MLWRCLSPYLGLGEQPVLSTRNLDLMVGFHVSLLDTLPPSQALPPSLVEAVEVHHRLVERKSFVSLKLRKERWKQSPQNNPKRGRVYSADEFLMLLGSERAFSALK